MGDGHQDSDKSQIIIKTTAFLYAIQKQQPEKITINYSI
jgi:hypothetical protein